MTPAHAASTTTRVLIDRDPFLIPANPADWLTSGLWPCRWGGLPGALPPFVVADWLTCTLNAHARFRAHVSAAYSAIRIRSV